MKKWKIRFVNFSAIGVTLLLALGFIHHGGNGFLAVNTLYDIAIIWIFRRVAINRLNLYGNAFAEQFFMAVYFLCAAYLFIITFVTTLPDAVNLIAVSLLLVTLFGGAFWMLGKNLKLRKNGGG